MSFEVNNRNGQACMPICFLSNKKIQYFHLIVYGQKIQLLNKKYIVKKYQKIKILATLYKIKKQQYLAHKLYKSLVY
jgi:hypothetical protein